MRSKVRIPLGANNSLGSARRRSRSIIQSVWRGHFTWVRDSPDWSGYTKWPYLEGVPRHQKEFRFKDVSGCLCFCYFAGALFCYYYNNTSGNKMMLRLSENNLLYGGCHAL
jgi:hypothetical protein